MYCCFVAMFVSILCVRTSVFRSVGCLVMCLNVSFVSLVVGCSVSWFFDCLLVVLGCVVFLVLVVSCWFDLCDHRYGCRLVGWLVGWFV